MGSESRRRQQAIRSLEHQCKFHREAAIENNEPPGGYHRQQAERLDAQLELLQSQRADNTRSGQLSTILVALATSAGVACMFHISSIQQLLNTSENKKSPYIKQTAVAGKRPVASSNPSLPAAKPDPALAMQKLFSASPLGGSFQALDENIDQYQRASGTLARIQSVAMNNRAVANQLPQVWINRANNQCFDGPTLGAYSPKCQAIRIDFTDYRLSYTHPVGPEVVLAHEWGHHLIHISGATMSPTEKEVVSDCFAGALFGYYALHNLVTPDEALRAIGLMKEVSNNSHYGYHPNMEVRQKAFAAGVSIVADPNYPGFESINSTCASLHHIVNVEKIRQLGLTWKS